MGMSMVSADTTTDAIFSGAVGVPQVVEDISRLEQAPLGIGVVEVGNGNPALCLL